MNTANEYNSVLAGMLTDLRFRRFKRFRYYGEVNGAKIGVVIANKNMQYHNYTVNKEDLADLLAAKHRGAIDHAFIVAVDNGAFIECHDAEEMHNGLLVHLQTRNGQFGEFWTLTDYEMTGEEEPF